MPSNALRHALGQKCTDNFELLRGFIPFQGIVAATVRVKKFFQKTLILVFEVIVQPPLKHIF